MAAVDQWHESKLYYKSSCINIAVFGALYRSDAGNLVIQQIWC